MSVIDSLCWCSDIHLDSCEAGAVDAFIKSVKADPRENVLITGDIANGTKCIRWLKRIAEETGKPIFVVAGNHERWHSSIAEIEDLLTRLSEDKDNKITYLQAVSPIILDLVNHVYLVGVDGYADGRAGNIFKSSVWLNDYNFCADFNGCGKSQYALAAKLNALGDRSVVMLQEKIEPILPVAKKIIIATHAPPFEVAHWFDGKLGEKEFSPHFVNAALGEYLKDVSGRNRGCSFHVLCGHTHEGVHVKIDDNLECMVGWAKYGEPWIQKGNLPFFNAREVTRSSRKI